ncbi:hypothetical protein H9Q72_007757 [Fusarium xylarioides]|uniref:Uncharacterized protein n=1 Tax=Fusarium xylarioides TaxID=221167 RepID=A0A9P7HQT3_9HYPO|nr:hypothetical protein H9Q70_008017 [Fusarium xylarioides]KAG5764147.1 hypothetical protein H9Q72_007757 [Fusarium xylarioides]KAG5778209.1 hypothetical protein H9Q73_008115 [Fusarium xylarioides]
MELSWLQNLNLLLGRTVNVVNQADESTADMSKEVKHTLLCLANRFKNSGGKRVVTNEHLIKAIHYFDVRMLVHDVNELESDNPTKPQNGFNRQFFVDQSSSDVPDARLPSSDNQDGASLSTATKRKASYDPTSSAFMPQISRARKSS